MVIHNSNNFRTGLKIMIEREPYAIESSEFIKPGKGQAFVRVKLRRLLTGTRIEKTFKATDCAESANVIDTNLIYLYNDSKLWYFMNKKTFEQFYANKKVVGENAKWLIEQTECTVTLWNSQPICITPPKFVELEILKTDPYIKGDTIGTGSKLATLSTGVIVRVPLFLKTGEVIKVNTRSGEYISRVK